MMSIRMCCRDVRTDVTLNYSNLLDIDGSPDTWLGCLDGSLGFDFFDLESAQNILLSILNHFSEMKTLK
jgi:hypothetical protein